MVRVSAGQSFWIGPKLEYRRSQSILGHLGSISRMPGHVSPSLGSSSLMPGHVFFCLGLKFVLFRQCSPLQGALSFPHYFRHAVTVDHHVTKIMWKNLLGHFGFGFAKHSLSLTSWGSNARCTHNCPDTPCTITSSCFALVLMQTPAAGQQFFQAT